MRPRRMNMRIPTLSLEKVIYTRGSTRMKELKDKLRLRFMMNNPRRKKGMNMTQ